MIRILVSIAAAVFLAGCASTNASAPRAGDCLDARRSVHLVEIESTSMVVVRQDPSRYYRVAIQECPDINERSMVSVSNGMPRPIYRGNRPPVWASTIVGSGRACGGGIDHFAVHRPGDQFRSPPKTCRIIGVERISDPRKQQSN